MSEQALREAWQEPVHAEFFDGGAAFDSQNLRRWYESFNEIRLFCEYKKHIQGRRFVEIGCATGELYRYLEHFHPEFSYCGFDISRPAIERAGQKYPGGRFDECEPDLSNVIGADLDPAVVFSRDVVHHQPDPFAYLSELLPISNEITVLRIRTRDTGASVLDPELSCQWHYNHWVPFIILNVDEVIEAICKMIPVKQLFIVKRYVQLGGWHNRFVPKECFYPETGTAETAVYIVRSEDEDAKPEITMSDREDSDLAIVPPLWERGMRYLKRRLSGW